MCATILTKAIVIRTFGGCLKSSRRLLGDTCWLARRQIRRFARPAGWSAGETVLPPEPIRSSESELELLGRVRPKLPVFGHILEAYGEEKLAYDAVNGIHEGVLSGKAGLLSVLKISFLVLWSFATLAKIAYTQLVNAAIVRGWRGYIVRKPIVVKI